MSYSNAIYIAIMSIVTLSIKILPMTLIRRQIENRFIRSFLYYVPYVTLAVMTFPSITEATQSPLAGMLALVFGIVAAWFNAGLFPVALICCIAAFATEFFLV